MRKVQIEIKMTTIGDGHNPENVERISVYADGHDQFSVAATGVEKLFSAMREAGALTEPVEATHKITHGLY